MGHGTDLTREEQSAILMLNNEHYGPRCIAQKGKRSGSAVAAVVKGGRVCVQSKRKRRKRKISTSLHRLLLRKARTGKYTARQLRDSFATTVSVRRVLQLLHAAPALHWGRMLRAPKLTNRHRAARLLWAKKHLAVGVSFWKRTIFSDEKR